MVRVLELLVGLVLFPWSVWVLRYPRRSFELGKKIGFVGMRNREQLELNSWGVLRQRVGGALFFLLAVFLILDGIYVVT